MQILKNNNQLAQNKLNQKKGFFIHIETAKQDCVDWLNEMIKREFPYTAFTPQHIEERINNPKYLILIAKQENIITGFAELELFPEKKEARLNAVFVEESWRDQKIGTTLVRHAINQCKHKKIQRLFLLVKIENFGAKHLYEEVGFSFEKMHDKIIDDSEVEVWGMKV
jgi:N-acetylglutamate synthase-like GNAT family acetyltransferase